MRVKTREPEASAAFPEEMILELDLGRCVRYVKENLKWKKSAWSHRGKSLGQAGPVRQGIGRAVRQGSWGPAGL